MEATQYIVGGYQGWDSDVDYFTWMAGRTFYVGDSLGGALFLISILHSFYKLGTFKLFAILILIFFLFFSIELCTW